MAQWQLPPRKFHLDLRKENMFDGGINNGSPNFYIKDSQSSDEYGFDTFDYPAISVRKGRAAYGLTGSGNTNMLANYQNSYMVRAVGTIMQRDVSGVWTPITGATGLTSTDWDYTNFNAKIIMTNGTDNVKSWDGTTFTDLNASAPKGKYITNNTIRVYIANVVGKTDWVYYSKYLDETNWTDTTSYGFFQYYTPNGGPITALHLYQNNIIAFKQDAFSLVVSTGSSSNKHRLVEVSSQVGCVSYKTIQEVRGLLFFLGLTDVYVYTGGQPTPIGQDVRATLDSINKTYYSKCFSGTDGQRYYLGLVTGANTEPDTLLVYDTKYKVWRVYSISLGGLKYSTFINNQWFCGDSAGMTHMMNSGTTDNGSPIPWQYTSKAFDEGAQEAEKEYYEMHIQSYLPSGSSLSVAVSTSDRGSSFTTIDTITTSSAAQNSNTIIPMDTVPITNWLRYQLSGTGPATIYQVQRMGRIQPTQI